MEEPLDFEPQEQGLAIGWKILSFLLPIAGAIIYFNHNGKNQTKANSACYAALFGIGLNIVLKVLTAGIS